jgi:hypothetical protein
MSRELLTQEQVDTLPDGTKVFVIWVGGNGPHEYTKETRDGYSYAFTDGHEVSELEFIGEYPRTQVWLA